MGYGRGVSGLVMCVYDGIMLEELMWYEGSGVDRGAVHVCWICTFALNLGNSMTCDLSLQKYE